MVRTKQQQAEVQMEECDEVVDFMYCIELALTIFNRYLIPTVDTYVLALQRTQMSLRKRRQEVDRQMHGVYVSKAEFCSDI